MKKLIALALVCLILTAALASCDLQEIIGGIVGGTTTTQPNDPKPDVPQPTPPVGDDHTEHTDADKNHLCDVCGAKLSECADSDKNHLCDLCGAKLSDCADNDKNHLCDVCGAKLSECIDEDSDRKCDICGGEVAPEYEDVSYSFNISGQAPTKLAQDLINGRFTIVSGTTIRNRTKTYEGVEYTQSVKLGDNTSAIKVSVPGSGKLSFLIQNGSSGVETQYVKVTAPDGTSQSIEFVGNSKGNPVVKIELDVVEGEYTIKRESGTIDIFYLELNCSVEKSPENGFELVSTGNVDYLVGDTLSTKDLVLNATFKNGKTESLPLNSGGLVIDVTGVDMSKSGVYDVVVSYKDYDPITYKVYVYAPQSITLGFDATEKLSKNNSAGNGVYFNHSFKEVYAIGETFDKSGLSVTVSALCGETSKTFIRSDYTVSGFDSETAGAKALTIACAGLKKTHTVYVVGTDASVVNGVAQVKVDHAYTGEIGAVVDGYNVFTTVQQALDFLARVDAKTDKLIAIAPGTYTEKLEITLPNLTLKGLGEKAGDVIIEWNSIYGVCDASGFSQVTDSTATVAVREEAYNCTVLNLTISNYWNSQKRLTDAGLEIERALALLVQADQFVMKNGALLGVQDTLEVFKGRQYFENVFISGYTDFIFGTNNTTLFKGCTIHVIDTLKDDKGTAGYITAFKGSNKGADDAVLYGAIFDGCKFTADEGVTAGNTAIGRTWGAYAAVAVINSELGGHISTKGYSTGKNERYVSMSGVKPTDSTVKFVEYNNTGAGAVTEAVAGMRMLTEEEAVSYADISVIFGTENGKVTYNNAWDPNSTEEVVDNRTYYYFNGQSSATGTSYTYTEKIEGATGKIGDIAIDATSGKVDARASDTQINAGSKLTLSVKAGTTVIIETYPKYHAYSVNGTAATEDRQEWTFDTDTEVVILADGQYYLYSIIIVPAA